MSNEKEIVIKLTENEFWIVREALGDKMMEFLCDGEKAEKMEKTRKLDPWLSKECAKNFDEIMQIIKKIDNDSTLFTKNKR